MPTTIDSFSNAAPLLAQFDDDGNPIPLKADGKTPAAVLTLAQVIAALDVQFSGTAWRASIPTPPPPDVSPPGTLSRVVAWDAPSSPPSTITAWLIRFGTTSGGPYPFTLTTADATTSATLTGLSVGTWYFTVAAILSGIAGEDSLEGTFVL